MEPQFSLPSHKMILPQFLTLNFIDYTKWPSDPPTPTVSSLSMTHPNPPPHPNPPNESKHRGRVIKVKFHISSAAINMTPRASAD